MNIWHIINNHVESAYRKQSLEPMNTGFPMKCIIDFLGPFTAEVDPGDSIRVVNCWIGSAVSTDSAGFIRGTDLGVGAKGGQ